MIFTDVRIIGRNSGKTAMANAGCNLLSMKMQLEVFRKDVIHLRPTYSYRQMPKEMTCIYGWR